MNRRINNKALLLILLSFFILKGAGCRLSDARHYKTDFEIPPRVTFIRAFGEDDERKPPVIIISDKATTPENIVGNAITIELDVSSNIPPPLIAKFVHCSADWTESGNIFLNDIIFSKTTLFDWVPAPMSQNYYGYRARLNVPNQQVKFKHSGNWKAMIYNMDTDELLAETRFFVVQPRAQAYMGMSLDFYKSDFKVINTGVDIEGVVRTSSQLVDGNVNTAVLYKNHRWHEPYMITNRIKDNSMNRYRYDYETWVRGIVYSGKSFRIDGLPAENAYRVLNLHDMAYFPPGPQPVRLPWSDLRRNGTFLDYDDDGAMLSYLTPPEYQDYALVEFVLDPQGVISEDDVFVSGSFNNWNPDSRWEMHYDAEMREYRLRAWVPRARHNYMYLSGKLDIQSNSIYSFSYDEYEGNTSGGNQTYFMFFYYRESEYGGFDSIIAVASTSILNTYSPSR